jgi:hypothetical protein
MECEVEGYEIRCVAPCTGEEDKCLVYQTTTKGGLKVICRDHGNIPTDQTDSKKKARGQTGGPGGI